MLKYINIKRSVICYGSEDQGMHLRITYSKKYVGVTETLMKQMKRNRNNITHYIIVIINGYPKAGRRPLFPSEVDNFNTNINKN